MADRIQKIIGPRGTAYLVRVEYPPDPVTGKRRQRSKSFTTKKEAEKELAKWLVEIERGTAIEGSKMTVGEYLDHWLTTIARHAVRETSYQAYETTIRVHLKPALSSVPLQRLSPARVQECYANLLAAGHSAVVVNKCHLRLSQALRQAVRWQMVSRNVCDAVDPPRVIHKQAATWTAEDVKKFLAFADKDGYHPYWLLAITTGMRRGELLGLRWQDVDIARSRVHVRQSVTVGKKGAPIFQEPKTPKARRVIPIPVEVATALHQHRVQQNKARLACGPAWRDHDLVFTVADGGPINPGNLLRNMRAIIAKINKDAKKDDERLPVLTIHALRHTHATLLLQQGQNAKVIQERLGHANISMTLSTYAHVLPNMQEEAADAIGAMFFGETANAREVVVK